MKKVFVACGSGVATSQTVASKIQNMCDDENLSVEVEAVDIKSIETLIKHCDIFVSITNADVSEYNVPVINGIAFLTGMGIEEEFDKLKSYLN